MRGKKDSKFDCRLHVFEKGYPWDDGSTKGNLGSQSKAAGSSSYIVAKSQAIGDGSQLVDHSLGPFLGTDRGITSGNCRTLNLNLLMAVRVF